MAFTHHVHPADSGTEQGLLVTLAGEMDVSVARRFETDMQRLISGRRPAIATLDLAAVTFLDSTAVSVLVRLWRMARRRHCSVRVINATGPVRHVLEVTGALAVLAVGVAPEATG